MEDENKKLRRARSQECVLNCSDDWTFVEDINTKHNQLLTSICMDRSAAQKNTKTEDWTVFKEVQLLPVGDDIENLDAASLNKGTLVVTKYELVFADQKETEENQKNHRLPHETDPSKIPLHVIAKIESYRQFPTILDIWCKDLRTVRFRFEDANSAFSFGTTVQLACRCRPEFFAFFNREEFHGTEDGWTLYDCEREFFQRQRLSTRKWKLLNKVNSQWELCRTYPRQFVVPASVKDATLRAAARFRSHERIPALCWCHRKNKATLTRCSQPMVGLMQQRSTADEELLRAINDTNPANKTMYIIDCRPWVNAYASTARGAGTEKMVYYPNCRLLFMNIDNIHTMRESFRQLAEVLRRKQDARWYSSVEGLRWLLEGKSWLEHTSLVLQAANKIAEIIDVEGSSVLVHCSDGWDRTSQLSALAQLVLDPYFRTITGFEVLIEKEWLAFGHKFDSRCGHTHLAFFENSECSPIFLQFADCVFQLHTQFPQAFEFNEQFLVTLMDHVYSCKYGTFLYDNERQREQHGVRQKTISLWTYMNHNKRYFLNPIYDPTSVATAGHVLKNVRTAREELTFWKGFYLRYHSNYRTPIDAARALMAERAMGLENKRLGDELREMQQRLDEEERERAALQEELGRVSQQKRQLEDVVQRVQCTVYRREGEGEKPYLVARISSPSRELANHLCDDLRNLKIIEDYCSSDKPPISKSSSAIPHYSSASSAAPTLNLSSTLGYASSVSASISNSFPALFSFFSQVPRPASAPPSPSRPSTAKTSKSCPSSPSPETRRRHNSKKRDDERAGANGCPDRPGDEDDDYDDDASMVAVRRSLRAEFEEIDGGIKEEEETGQDVSELDDDVRLLPDLQQHKRNVNDAINDTRRRRRKNRKNRKHNRRKASDSLQRELEGWMKLPEGVVCNGGENSPERSTSPTSPSSLPASPTQASWDSPSSPSSASSPDYAAACRQRRKRSDSVIIEDGDSMAAGNGDRDRRVDPDEEGKDDDDDDEDKDTELSGEVGGVDGDCSATQAALELAASNEVVRLELSDASGSWTLPIKFSDYLETLSHYLLHHGVIPSFRWPYST